MSKPGILPLAELRERIEASATASRAAFARTGDGRACMRRRSAEVESLLREIWSGSLRDRQAPAAVFALGGFGRGELFPFSDVDVLFLFVNESEEREAHGLIRAVTQAMWDVGLRASPATRTLKECERLDGETNLEFAISLLDRRFLMGDTSLGTRFENELLPAALLREAGPLEMHLAEAARARHARYSDTIFHLLSPGTESEGVSRRLAGFSPDWLAETIANAGERADLAQPCRSAGPTPSKYAGRPRGCP